MFIVTGANGQLGRLVVEALLDRVPVDEIGVSVRDVDDAEALADRGVRVREGDFAEPETLAHAFEDASQVLIVSVDQIGPEAVALHREAIDAAVAAGAQRILYTSHMGARADSPFPPAADHAATEAALAASGVAYTTLRNGFHAASAALQLEGALHTGELAVPEDGPIAWTAHADLAEAAAAILVDHETDGATVPLTGSEALDAEELAAAASELLGRPIRRVVVSDDEYIAGLMVHGLPEPMAMMLAGMFRAAARGDFARLDPTLGHLIGREPTPLQDVLADLLPMS